MLIDRFVPAWAGRNLRIVLVARTAMSVARSVGGIVTALYLASEGFSALRIGELFIAVTVASAVMSTGVGLASDRVGRKPFMVGLPLLAAAAAVVFAELRAPAALWVAAALGSFGRGAGSGGGNVGPYQPAEAALVADEIDDHHRSDAFGRLAFTATLGALVGALLAGLVSVGPHETAVAATAAYRPVFLAAAGLAAFAGLLALGIREPTRSAPTQRTRISWPRRSWPALWRFSLTNAFNGAGIGMLGPFVAYWFHRRYGASPGTIGDLFALINLASLASTLGAARIGRRFGTVRAIVAVRSLTGLLLVPMVIAPSFWAAGAIYALRMAAQRVALPLRQSYTQELADPDERASVAALSNLPTQATMAGGQALAGYLFSEVSLAAPFELAAVFQCANAVLYGLLFAWRPPRRPAVAVAVPAAGSDGAGDSRGGAAASECAEDGRRPELA